MQLPICPRAEAVSGDGRARDIFRLSPTFITLLTLLLAVVDDESESFSVRPFFNYLLLQERGFKNWDSARLCSR